MLSTQGKATTLLVLSTSVAILAILAKWVLVPVVIQDQVYKNLALIEGTEGYKAWVKPPNSVFMKYYFYHVENPEDIKAGGKPIVRQVGPYVYSEVREKENIAAVGEEKLFYGQYIKYTFDQEETVRQGCQGVNTSLPCTARDEVRIVNSALTGIVDIIHSLPSLPLPPEVGILFPGVENTNDLLYFLISMSVLDDLNPTYRDDLFYYAAIDDILWQGHSPGIIRFFFYALNSVEEAVETYFNETMGLALELELEKFLPPQLKNGSLAFFRGKNATAANSYYLVNRGRAEKQRFVHIEELNGLSQLPERWWPDIAPSPSAKLAGIKGTCHLLEGTDGTFFSPFISKDYPLWLYVPDLCRSVYAYYDTETEIRGIPAWRYRASTDLLDFSLPKNLCFCPAFKKCLKEPESGEDVWDKSECHEPCQNGTLHASGCFGVPVVLTAPHFFQADDRLAEAIEGMHPDRDLHDTYLDVDPISGVTLAAHKRGQINVQLRRIKLLNGFENLQSVVFPVFWADEGAYLEEQNADLYKSMVTTPLLLVDIFVYGIGLVLCPIGILVAFYIICLKKRRF